MMPLAGVRLLVVEDDADLRHTLIDVTEALGALTAAASGGIAAWALLTEQPYDLVISDLRMPDGDGLGLLRRIRERDTLRPPVLLVSGHADLKPNEARELGAVGLLTKPFTLDALTQAIASALAPPVPGPLV